MNPSRVNITPDPLPRWRRILGLGRSKAAIEADLAAAVHVANENANMVDRLQTGRRFEKLWGAQQPKRNVGWPKSPRLPKEDVREAFAEPLDEGLQAAIHQELDDYLQELLDQVSQPPGYATGQKGELIPTMTAEQRLHLAGGIEHLRLFQKQLIDLNAEANRRETDEAPDKDGGDQ
jgi:hypothetical protein